MNIELLASLGCMFGILLFFIGLASLTNKPNLLRARIDDYAALGATTAPGETPATDSNRFRGLVSESLTQQIAIELARADILLTPTEYILVNLMSISGGYALGFYIFRENYVLGLVGALVGLYAPRLYLRYAQQRRLVLFESQLGSTLTLLANGLRSGYGLLQAIDVVAKEAPPPTSVEFQRIVREFSLGVSLQTALANMLRRNPSADLDMVITAININHEVGGKLSEVLDAIASTVRERVRISREIRALTAQQRFSATVLTLLPMLVGLAIFAVNPDYLALLWQHTCGYFILVFSVTMVIIGNLVIRRVLAVQY